LIRLEILAFTLSSLEDMLKGKISGLAFNPSSVLRYT